MCYAAVLLIHHTLHATSAGLGRLTRRCRLCGPPVAERGPLSNATAGHEALTAGHR